MTDKPMTIGDLREFIKELPDEIKILVHYNIPCSYDRSEMLPLGELYLEEGEGGKILEIYPEFPSYYV